MTPTRVIRDGQVAVLYAPGYGAGWSTWNDDTDDGMEYFLLFDPTLVKMVLQNEHDRVPSYVESVYPDAYTSAARQLCVKWVPQGCSFRVTEYDGFECVQLEEDIVWKVV